MIAILVPKLGRPERNRPLLDSLAQSTVGAYEVIFLCSPHDHETIAACASEPDAETIVTPFVHGPGDYARKINLGYQITSEPWIFMGADDLNFRHGWDSEALTWGARYVDAGVIGTNDIGNPRVRRGLMATHSLIRRTYIDDPGGSLDGPGIVLHEGYSHNFVDEELCGLARKRRAFRFAKNSIVEHLHPHWGKAEMDETYELGLAGFDEDRDLWAERHRAIRLTPAR